MWAPPLYHVVWDFRLVSEKNPFKIKNVATFSRKIS
jgi:hypothetical protein